MKGLKPFRVDGGFNRLTEILPALRDTDGGLLTTRWIVRRFESSTECGFLCYYCSMGVVRAVLNADSVDSTAGDKQKQAARNTFSMTYAEFSISWMPLRNFSMIYEKVFISWIPVRE